MVQTPPSTKRVARRPSAALGGVSMARRPERGSRMEEGVPKGKTEVRICQVDYTHENVGLGGEA